MRAHFPEKASAAAERPQLNKSCSELFSEAMQSSALGGSYLP